MSEKLYETIEISDLKDMLNKTKKIYGEKPAYKIKQEEGKYKIITHKQVREMVDALGTALIDLGLKNKRIAIYVNFVWFIYIAIFCMRNH